MTPELAGRLMFLLDRAWDGAELCRRRLEQAGSDAPRIGQVVDLRGYAGHDVDYYAWEAVRIVNIAEKALAAGLRGRDEVRASLEAITSEAPYLEAFRNAVTHPEDNRGADEVVYFTNAVRLRQGGGVEYLVDPHDRTHVLLKRLADVTHAALGTLAAAGDRYRFGRGEAE